MSRKTQQAAWHSIVPLFLLTAGVCFAATPSPVAWSFQAPQAIKAGDLVQGKLTAKVNEGWHVYSITQKPGGPIRTTISLATDQPFKLDGQIEGPKPKRIMDPNFNMETELHDGVIDYKVPIRAGMDGVNGPQPIRIAVRFQTCNDTQCLPPRTVKLEQTISLSGASGRSIAEQKTSQTPPAASAASPKPVTSGPDYTKSSLLSFLWLAMGLGALSLLTPCVFPMIPITVSYFTNHSAQNKRSAVTMALTYSVGIVLTFTALGMALAILFGAGGVNKLASSPWVNLLITLIFIGFALSLFGAYLIQVPPALISKLSSVTGSEESSGVAGTLVMGLIFSLTSFTCTAPFVGTLLVLAAQGNWKWPLVGMLGFSSVFAVPFFVLALMPQLMAQMPKAGGWLNSVKVVMGFLEIAAAMKFLSNVDLIWHWNIFTREAVLAIWVATGILIVLYLLGKFQMSHDSPVQSVTAFRAVMAIVFLSVSVWLGTGLLGKPLGELESFLPPPSNIGGGATSSAQSGSSSPAEMSWVLNDFEGGLKLAKEQSKSVFIDFTGYTCTNCRWMEANMFPRSEVRQELDKFVRLRLYTDGAGDLYEKQQNLEQERFGTIALPFYAVLSPDGKLVASFPGLTRNPEEFLRFLRTTPEGSPTSTSD